MTYELKPHRHFTCRMCFKNFITYTTDKELIQEVKEIMPESINDEMVTLCDDCWKIFMEWFNKLSPEEKIKMREEPINDN